MSYLADARFAHNYNCYNGYFIGCLQIRIAFVFLRRRFYKLLVVYLTSLTHRILTPPPVISLLQ